MDGRRMASDPVIAAWLGVGGVRPDRPFGVTADGWVQAAKNIQPFASYRRSRGHGIALHLSARANGACRPVWSWCPVYAAVAPTRSTNAEIARATSLGFSTSHVCPASTCISNHPPARASLTNVSNTVRAGYSCFNPLAIYPRGLFRACPNGR